MIKVRILKTKDIDGVIISGHANYDVIGKDIVCSSVSSIVITTVNGIHLIDNEYLSIIEEKDKLTLTINKENDTCMKLIKNMLSLLSELEEQYPKNLSVK